MAEPPPKTDSPFEFQSLPAGKQASVLHLSEIQAVLQSIAANKCLLTTPSFLSTAPMSYGSSRSWFVWLRKWLYKNFSVEASKIFARA